MKKDIEIPEVTGIEIAVVLEHNEAHNEDDWSVYIINKKEVDIEIVVVVSQGFSDTKTTSLFRRKVDKLPANSFAKFEIMQPELFGLDNRFQVSFFEGNQLHEKTFLFEKDSIKEEALRFIKLLDKNGVICK